MKKLFHHEGREEQKVRNINVRTLRDLRALRGKDINCLRRAAQSA